MCVNRKHSGRSFAAALAQMKLQALSIQKEDQHMRRGLTVSAVGIMFLLASGCASTEALNSRISALEDRVGKLEKATPSLEAQAAKANDAAVRAEAAAKKAEEAAVKSEAAEKAAAGAEKKAETAEKKTTKEFELMQKK